jgi:hypothetical protein
MFKASTCGVTRLRKWLATVQLHDASYRQSSPLSNE